MKYIFPEDLPSFSRAVGQVIATLGNGIKRADTETYLTEIQVAQITGYWVNDLMRIDIRFKEYNGNNK